MQCLEGMEGISNPMISDILCQSLGSVNVNWSTESIFMADTVPTKDRHLHKWNMKEEEDEMLWNVGEKVVKEER